ncbi:hypothetical protein B0H14DRAFT_2873977, partial [Mycena olivaceomarginata]
MEQNASAHTVLRIQEICDYITDFLHSSSTDLNSCALISRLFTAPAQYHLFGDIDATWYRFGDPSVAASSSQRLCTVLLSPHLVCLVRRLRLSLCPEIIVPLAQVRFTRLETLRLDGGPTMARVSDKTLSLAAGIVGLPSIRCVQFVSVVLNDIESLGALFRQRSTLDRLAMDNTIITSASPVQPRPFDAGQHRVVLNSVEITDAMGTAHDSWVVHALCPFDFSAVTNMNIAVETSLKMIGIMHSVAPSLTTLQIDATFATPAFRLSAFPALTTLTVLGWYRGSAPAAALLESVGSKNVISQLSTSGSPFFGSQTPNHSAPSTKSSRTSRSPTFAPSKSRFRAMNLTGRARMRRSSSLLQCKACGDSSPIWIHEATCGWHIFATVFRSRH